MPLKAINSKDDEFANVLHAEGEGGKFRRRPVALTFVPGILLTFMFTDQEHSCLTSWDLAAGPDLSEMEP